MQEIQETRVPSLGLQGRCLGEGNGNPLQHSYLENSTDRGPWWAVVHGAADWDAPEENEYSSFLFQVYDVMRYVCIL